MPIRVKKTIITTRKRSLGQDNVFTSVILFIGRCIPACNGAGGLSQHAIGQGVCIPGCNWAGGGGGECLV